MDTLPNNRATACALLHAAHLGSILVLDLDGVLIDARHRQVTLADGSLNLKHYLKNNTPEKIAQDSPLPLLKVAQDLTALKIPFHIATARVFNESVRFWLASRGVVADRVIHRVSEKNRSSDHALKLEGFRNQLSDLDPEKLLLIDDCAANVRTMQANGYKALQIAFEGF